MLGVGEGLAWVVGFLADELKVRVGSEEAGGDHLLYRFIGFGDEIGGWEDVSR